MRRFKKVLILIILFFYVIPAMDSYALRVNSLFDKIDREADAKRAEDLIRKSFPSLFEKTPLTASKIKEIKEESKPMDIEGLWDVLFTIVRKYKDRKIKTVLMGPGLTKLGEDFHSSPQTGEFLAVLNYGKLDSAEVIIIDKDQKVLDLNSGSIDYVSFGGFIGYSEQMVSALSDVLIDPKQTYSTFYFNVEIPDNMTLETRKADFKDFTYGDSELDLIVATATLDKVLSNMNDINSSLAFMANIINGLKPGGKLLIDVHSLFFTVPGEMLDYVVPEWVDHNIGIVKSIDRIDKRTRFGLMKITNFFEDGLYAYHGISVKTMFYKGAVEITRLESGTKTEPALDISSREMKIPSPDLRSLYSIDLNRFRKLEKNL